MDYQIEIKKLVPREGNYPLLETVYVQVVNEEEIDIEKIIKAVNQID